MIILDTSVLIASEFENDLNHLKAVELRDKLAKEKQFITYGVLVELSQFFYQARGSAFAAAEIANALDSFNVLKLEDFDELSELYLANHKKLSLVDCEIVALTRQHGANVLSFDGKLLKAIR